MSKSSEKIPDIMASLRRKLNVEYFPRKYVGFNT